MLRTATGVNLGATSVRAVRLALRDGQLEVAAVARKDFHVCEDESPAPTQGVGAGSESSNVEVPIVVLADGQDDGKAGLPEQDVAGQKPPAARPAARREASESRRERDLRADLASVLRRIGGRSSQMVLGLSGSQGLIRYLQVPPVPPWKLDMMMKYEVQEQGSSAEPSAFDYRILDLPDVGGQLTVMLSQVQERKLSSRLELARRAGMGRPDVDMNCLGLFNAYVHGHGAEAERTVMVVDIGAENIDMVVARGSSLYFARSVAGGGSRFTASVAELLHMSQDEAENLKCSRGAILASEAAEDESLPVVQRRLSQVLEREMGALAGVIDSSLMYCRAQTKQARLRPDEVLISGGGSMLPGLPEALARRLRMRVNRLEPFRKISMGSLVDQDLEEVASQGPRYAVAVGLAASRLLAESIRFSMELESDKARRRFLDGGIYVWYAAGVIWIAAATLIWAPWRNKRILSGELERRRGLTEQAVKDRAEFDGAFASVRQRGDEVKALEERVYSGRDIVKVLSHLKKRTGGIFQKDVVILEASNTVPSVVPDPRPEEKTQSFQKARCVYLRGIATAPIFGSGQAAEDDAEYRAHKLVESYRRELENQAADRNNDIIQSVIPRYQDAMKSGAKTTGQPQARVQFVLQAILKPIELKPGVETGEAKAAAPAAGVVKGGAR